MNEPLVSIIIPTYNRAHLIGETLDSVLAQTYSHWECIVVDDGSNDNTAEVLQEYCQRDARIQFHRRPEHHRPGGNGARNYGLALSNGDYLQWFDSDDIMDAKNLEVKLNTIIQNNVDFVISRTQFFNVPKESYSTYDFKEEDISFENFFLGKIKWITSDLFISKRALGEVKFSEVLKAGQEFNFCCKLLLSTKKCKLIDENLSFKRYNEESIQGQRDQDRAHHLKMIYHVYWNTYLELQDKHNDSLVNKFSLYQCIKSYFGVNGAITPSIKFYSKLLRVFGIDGLVAIVAIISYRLTGKYHRLYKYFQASLPWEIRH